MQINQKKYCLPIIKSNKKDVLDSINNSHGYTYFEVWVDYIEDLDFEFIGNLLFQYRDKLILVFRRLNLETPLMDEQRRMSLLSYMDKSEALLDLDVITQQSELTYIKDNNIKISLITSYHNYQQTPSDEKIHEIINVMRKYDPYIIKIATQCVVPKDALRLLELLTTLKSDGNKYIIMGMGEYGTMTRIYGAVWGNEIIFAPAEKSGATAPGQLTKEETEIILTILSNTKY